jgi:hypothetical protein
LPVSVFSRIEIPKWATIFSLWPDSLTKHCRLQNYNCKLYSHLLF